MNTHNDNRPDASDAGPLLTAHALNELSEREEDQVERLLAADPQAGQTALEVERLATALRETCGEPAEANSAGLRELVVARLDELEADEAKVGLARSVDGRSVRFVSRGWRTLALSLLACGVGVSIWIFSTPEVWQLASSRFDNAVSVSESKKPAKTRSAADQAMDEPFLLQEASPGEVGANASSGTARAFTETPFVTSVIPPAETVPDVANVATSPTAIPMGDFGDRTASKNDLGKTVGAIGGTGLEGRGNDPRPTEREMVAAQAANESARARVMAEYARQREEMARQQARAAKPAYSNAPWQPVHSTRGKAPGPAPLAYARNADGDDLYAINPINRGETQSHGEQYEAPPENAFLPVDKATALSTFSIDVDTASYANVRRFLSQGQLPPPSAVRIEEMLNYFRYNYPQPQGDDPFSVSMERADCPWQPGHELLRIGLKGKEVQSKERKAGNLVFLVDVSGSMQPENKLPLLKQSLKLLTGVLTENDTVTIVTYAGDAGLKLDATNGTRQNEIRAAIDSLSAGGSTHGSAGIELAYQQAAKSFIKGGTNRVILATDGDLNVGITDDGALVELIKTKAAGGVFLTVLGVGEGNLKDAKMEKLADNGNGVYAYLDSLREARKVLVEQLAGSLETIAKDVKIQIEFNPAEVQAYRLIGYENRVLATRDFHDDKKDAGEIGAGHTVTALYELVPARAKAAAKDEARAEGEPLKYQKTPEVKPAPEGLTPEAGSGEVLTLKLRFKQPDAETSKLREFPLKGEALRFNRASADFQFAAAVASFGMLLKNSQHRGDATFSAVEEIAAGSIGPDTSGYRAEFLDLVRKAKSLK